MTSRTADFDQIELAEDTREVRKRHGSGAPPGIIDDDFDPDNDANGETRPSIGNAFIATLLFLGADIMLFAGLIGAFVVFRYGAENWPPPGQPRLPVGVTAINTAILLLSGFLMAHTWRLLAGRNRHQIVKWLLAVLALGVAFLMVQGYEWLRLLDFGLKLSSGVFGATFYTLIGCHALHVIGAVIWLSAVSLRIRLSSHAFDERRIESVKLIGMYWFLVVALWPILYGLVYWS